jgi:hypothetical protein
MNLIQFIIALVLIVGLGLLVLNVNWSNECRDMFNLFKVRKGVKK